MTRKIVCFAFAWLAASAAFADAFTAAHLVRIDRVGAPAVSPSGDRIVYAVRHTDMEEDTGRYDLWLSTIDGNAPRQLTTHDANDSSPAWSPDGRHILFLSSRGGSTQVWRLPVAGGEAQPVTDLPVDVSVDSEPVITWGAACASRAGRRPGVGLSRARRVPGLRWI